MTWAQEAVWCKYQPEYRVTSKYVFSRNFPADCGRWQLSCSWWGSGHFGHWCHVFSYWYCISLGIINKCYTVYYEGSLFCQGPGACVGCISAHYPWEGWKSMSHEVYWVSLWGECSAECWVWRLIVTADWDWGAALVTNTIYYLHYLHYLLSTMLLCAAGERSADKPNCISSNSVFALDFINQALNLIFRIISSHCIRYLLNSGLEMGPGC